MDHDKQRALRDAVRVREAEWCHHGIVDLANGDNDLVTQGLSLLIRLVVERLEGVVSQEGKGNARDRPRAIAGRAKGGVGNGGIERRDGAREKGASNPAS